MPEQRSGACEQLPEMIVERFSLRSQKAGIPRRQLLGILLSLSRKLSPFSPEGLNSYSLVEDPRSEPASSVQLLKHNLQA